MLTKLSVLALAIISALSTFVLTGCSNTPTHPNQINTFDGASYDSLTMAHAALNSLRTTIATSYPRYIPAFNQAAASYSTAYNSYALFRTAPANSAAAAIAISNLTVSLVSLENAFQSDMHVTPKAVQKVRSRAAKFRAAAAPKVTISDILTELEIAASIAAAVPGTQPYSTIAAIVIKTTQEAVSAAAASAGQQIDLSTLQPIPVI